MNKSNKLREDISSLKSFEDLDTQKELEEIRQFD